MSRTKAFDEKAILEKAMQLFWCKGYNATSVQDLVADLGISRSSLYDTFGDKHQLYLNALQQYRRQMGGAMMDMIGQSTDIRQTLHDLFDMAVRESISDKLQKGCFMVNSTVELAAWHQDIAEIARKNMEDVEEAFYQAIQKGQQNEQISKKHDARALARFFFNSMNGLRVAAKSGSRQDTFQDIVNVSLSVLDD
jgi:TetR/AcrR family transcriptional repressor of nem operon